MQPAQRGSFLFPMLLTFSIAFYLSASQDCDTGTAAGFCLALPRRSESSLLHLAGNGSRALHAMQKTQPQAYATCLRLKQAVHLLVAHGCHQGAYALQKGAH